jgi:GT2 family glycosyltransferase/ubiquinone/menaquinone biosynthesis C-methylase UbiE
MLGKGNQKIVNWLSIYYSAIIHILRGKAMLTSIVILTYNQIEYTKLCIESIRRFTKIGTYEMIVVDNASTDGTIEWLKQQDDIKTIFNSENLGFPKGCNQGIEISTGDNILLLNNDTVVTQNWLDNLLTCLYSADDIGAVGPVTNSASYYSTVPVNYTSIDEMHRFAELFNKSNKESWEQRLKLIGFCMLIKRKVIEKIGLLDEQFTPGNYEDDDYSFRIQQAGYKLILCKDTFIHHYGGTSFRKDIDKYSKLLKINEEKFQEKWGFNPAYSTNIRNEIINLIDTPRETAINVLEIGCACGGTLLKIKDLYKKANIYGIEFNENSSLIASQFASVKAQDAQKEMDYPKDYFDYIILADVLEHLYDPWSMMKNIRKYLKENGKVLISIPNVMHYTLLKDLINGNWTYTDAGLLDKTHIRFFTLNEINKMLLEADYSNIELGYITVGKTEEDELFIQKLTKISNSSMETQYNANQYIIRATKSESKTKLEKILKSIENILPNDEDVKSELDLAELELFDTEEIITNIMMHLEKKVETLNYIAITNYGKGYLEDVLPYLKKALELKSDDSDTLYNLIFVLISFGELDLAKQFFRSSTKKNKELILLYKEIVQQEPIYNFLKKLEINPSDVESKLQLKTMIANDNSLLNEIKEIIEIVFNNNSTFAY